MYTFVVITTYLLLAVFLIIINRHALFYFCSCAYMNVWYTLQQNTSLLLHFKRVLTIYAILNKTVLVSFKDLCLKSSPIIIYMCTHWTCVVSQAVLVYKI